MHLLMLIFHGLISKPSQNKFSVIYGNINVISKGNLKFYFKRNFKIIKIPINNVHLKLTANRTLMFHIRRNQTLSRK